MNILKGILIGITNLIPGISAGTCIILLKIFDTYNNLKTNKLKQFSFVFKIFLGIFIGWIIFSKILDYLFSNYYIMTIYFFIGLVLFTLPIFIRDKINFNKLNTKYILLGVILIIIIGIIKNIITTNSNIPNLDDINFFIIIDMFIIGLISGFITIIPGISGSMFLLIFGKYYTYQSYLANFSFKVTIIIPIIFMVTGLIIGSFISFKLTNFLLTKYNFFTLNIIIGFIIGSIIILIPITSYNLSTIFHSIIGLISSFIIIKLYNFINT